MRLAAELMGESSLDEWTAREWSTVHDMLVQAQREALDYAADICIDESDFHCDHRPHGIQDQCGRQGCIALSVASTKLRNLADALSTKKS